MARYKAQILTALLLATTFSAQNNVVRVRDITWVFGARENQLSGIGMVAGLAGDGDKDPVYSKQMYSNFLKTRGINLAPDLISSKDVAAVMVTADLGPSLKNGSKIDVTVAALGDAKSINGGVLGQTPLFGADGQVYAVAQGAIAVGGFLLGGGGGGGGGASTVQKNHPTTGQIIGGALVEKDVPVTLVHDNAIEFILNDPDYTTAARMADAINKVYANSSTAVSDTTVRVKVPEAYRSLLVDWIARLQMIMVEPDTKAVVIMNERTGTIVATARIQISSVAVAQGNILVSIAETQDVSQPNPFGQGQTVTTTRTDTQITEFKGGTNGTLVAFGDMPTVEKVAASLNALGATPRDMMAIFQAMKQAGALKAELIIR